ncbi:MAG: inorganic diphosphatase [Firmicutes bacterium]|nr:inorganic diphosphatase [Bacillota bacterium]
MVLDVIVEIPKGSQNKYEVDHETGRIRLDRVLYSPFHYPTEYGFIEDTLAEDGDPLDVLLLISQPTFPGCIVSARVIGLLEMSDDKGPDNKVLAVADKDPRYDGINDVQDVHPHILKEISHFFMHYKDLENKVSRVGAWHGPDAAEKEIAASKQRAHG